MCVGERGEERDIGTWRGRPHTDVFTVCKTVQLCFVAGSMLKVEPDGYLSALEAVSLACFLSPYMAFVGLSASVRALVCDTSGHEVLLLGQ